MNIRSPKSVDTMMKIFLPLIFFGLMAGRVFAQTPPTETGKTNALSVDLWISPADRNLPAPATIHLVAMVSTTLPGHAGDTIKVNFLADSKHLGSATAKWHEGHHPDPNSHLPQPLVIVRPGYSGAEWIWKDVPVGTYSLTATIVGNNGLTAFSEPKTVTVKP